MCTRDASGMGVALIQSNYHGIGSALSAGNTGVFLHDREAGFTLGKGHPNELKPGKRPLHTLSPTLWTRGNDLAALLGTQVEPSNPSTYSRSPRTCFVHNSVRRNPSMRPAGRSQTLPSRFLWCR